MPLTEKGSQIKSALTKEYGEKKGEQVLYAGKNKGTFTGIDAAESVIDACNALKDAVEVVHRRIDAFTARRADAKSPAEHLLQVEFNGDFDMGELIRALYWLGQAGASRDVEVAADDRGLQAELADRGYKSKFGWDGDGADKIIKAVLDGVNLLK